MHDNKAVDIPLLVDDVRHERVHFAIDEREQLNSKGMAFEFVRRLSLAKDGAVGS